MTNDDRNNILIDLNRTGFWSNDRGIRMYSYIDKTHPDYAKGIRRMPISVDNLNYSALANLIHEWFDEYFERIHIMPPEADPRCILFTGVKKIRNTPYGFSERIEYDEANNMFKDGVIDNLRSWLQRHFDYLYNHPEQS